MLFFEILHLPALCLPPLILQLVYLHYSIWPSTANAALASHCRLQTFYPPSTHFVSSPSAPSPPPHAPGCFSLPPASSSTP